MQLPVKNQNKTIPAWGDPYHHALHVIDINHHEVHEGGMYSVSLKTAEGADLDDNANMELLVRVGANPVHLAGEVALGGDGEIFFYEDTEVTGGTAYGTAVSMPNKNRGSSNTPATTLVYKNPGVSADGTVLYNLFLNGGSGPMAAGGRAGGGSEWVLAANTLYLLRVINRSGGAVPAGAALEFYEEND